MTDEQAILIAAAILMAGRERDYNDNEDSGASSVLANLASPQSCVGEARAILRHMDTTNGPEKHPR